LGDSAVSKVTSAKRLLRLFRNDLAGMHSIFPRQERFDPGPDRLAFFAAQSLEFGGPGFRVDEVGKFRRFPPSPVGIFGLPASPEYVQMDFPVISGFLGALGSARSSSTDEGRAMLPPSHMKKVCSIGFGTTTCGGGFRVWS